MDEDKKVNPSRLPVEQGGNLRAYTSEQARHYGALGGKKSAANRKRKKNMVEQVMAVMMMPLDDKQLKALKKAFPNLDPDDHTMFSLLVAAQFREAMKGSTQAYNALIQSAENPNGSTEGADIDEALRKIGFEYLRDKKD